MKKLLIALLVISLSLSGCSDADDADDKTTEADSTEESTSDSAEEEAPEGPALPTVPISVPTEGWGTDHLPQFDDPEPGTPVATISTSMGDVKLMLFPQAAPLAVENFITHAENGYYDGVIFHRVMEGFMIQGGDPEGNGTGGESIWGVPFQDEPISNLNHFRGALSMANGGYHTNASQFFIVQSEDVYGAGEVGIPVEEYDDYIMARRFQLEATKLNTIVALEVAKGEMTEEELNAYIVELETAANIVIQAELTDKDREKHTTALDKYNEVGGTSHLDFMHTVFGQVIEGMDVVDAIAKVETQTGGDGQSTSPLEDITITEITIEYTP